MLEIESNQGPDHRLHLLKTYRTIDECIASHDISHRQKHAACLTYTLLSTQEFIMPAAIGQLNPQQQAAVTASTRHTLVIAGAGSGKTRVLVQRCIWLMQNQPRQMFDNVIHSVDTQRPWFWHNGCCLEKHGPRECLVL